MPEWLTVENAIAMALALVGVAAVVARFTPNEADDRWVQNILDFINSIGQNGGPNAKNK